MNILRHPAVIIVLILLVVLLFGSRKLPDFARSVGESLKIFKKEVKELKDDGNDAAPAAGTAPPAQTDTAPPAQPTVQPTAPPTVQPTAPAPAHSTAPSSSTQDDASSQVPGLVDPKQPRA